MKLAFSNFFILLLLLSLTVSSCRKVNVPSVHAEVNAVYYWKTVFAPDSADLTFLKQHDVKRLYLRMFDVVEVGGNRPDDITQPNASVSVDYRNYQLIADSLSDMEFVPVVFITLDALKAFEGIEGATAQLLVERVKNMCSYNELPNVCELQLDCDWTSSTEKTFFAFCDSVKAQIANQGLPWRLSSTIRLHQLRRKAPPVDNGVLMVYNTGNFDNPDVANSIIDIKDIKPYLRFLDNYPLHLDVAYPTYSWQLLFHERKFIGLLNGVNTADTTIFEQCGKNIYRAKRDIPYRQHIIRLGETIREESSPADDILAVKSLIEKHLDSRKHSNILYHLDSDNLSKYSQCEIDSIYSIRH